MTVEFLGEIQWSNTVAPMKTGYYSAHIIIKITTSIIKSGLVNSTVRTNKYRLTVLKDCTVQFIEKGTSPNHILSTEDKDGGFSFSGSFVNNGEVYNLTAGTYYLYVEVYSDGSKESVRRQTYTTDFEFKPA